MSEVVRNSQKTQLDIAGKSSAFFLLNQPLHARAETIRDFVLAI